MTKITNAMNKAAIETAIQSIARRGKQLDTDIQNTGLSIMAHFEQHHDVTLFNKLYLAMPKGSRRAALAEWFVKFGGVDVNMDKATAKDAPFVNPAKDARRPVNVAGATETPWFDMKKEPDLTEEFNFESMLAALLKRAEAAKAAGKVIIGADQLAAVTKVAHPTATTGVEA